ncbi:MAG: hypothetical protein ABI435_04375 [Pseudolysinimonas sp.]
MTERIYPFVASRRDPSGVGMTPHGYDLPDEAPGGLRFAAGFWENLGDIFGTQDVLHRQPSDGDARTTHLIVEYLATALTAKAIDLPGFERLLGVIQSDLRLVAAALPVIDAAEPVELQAVGRRLLLEGTIRLSVKLGLVMLGRSDIEGWTDHLLAAAQHDEFTTYVVLGFAGPIERRDQIANAARAAMGWGRVHAIKALNMTGGITEDVWRWLFDGGLRVELAEGDMLAFFVMVHQAFSRVLSEGSEQDVATALSIINQHFDEDPWNIALIGGPTPEQGAVQILRNGLDAALRHPALPESRELGRQLRAIGAGTSPVVPDQARAPMFADLAHRAAALD